MLACCILSSYRYAGYPSAASKLIHLQLQVTPDCASGVISLVRKMDVANQLFPRLHTSCKSTENLVLVSATFLLPRLQKSAKCTLLQLTTAARHDYRIRALAYLHPRTRVWRPKTDTTNILLHHHLPES
jgi:hypothetical protein